MITRRKFLQATSGPAATQGLAPATSARAESTASDWPNILPDQHLGQAVLPGHPTIIPNHVLHAQAALAPYGPAIEI
jgi:hypothetical protein